MPELRKRSPVLLFFLRAIPVVALLAIAVTGSELYVRKKYRSLLAESDVTCVRWDERAAVIRFRPNCHSTLTYATGTSHLLDTNEIGLRERPMATFAGTVAVMLGDSHVEGFHLEAEQAMGRRLEEIGADFFREKILSMGIRSYGARDELALLKDKLPYVHANAIIWVINENDLMDDLLEDYRASRPAGFLEHSRFNAKSEKLTAFSLLGPRMLMRTAEIWLAKRQYDTDGQAALLCRNVTEILHVVPPSTAIDIVAISHGTSWSNLDYYGVSVNREAFTRALGCMKSAGLPVLDLRPAYDQLAEYLIGGKNHLNAEGTRLFAPMLLQGLQKLAAQHEPRTFQPSLALKAAPSKRKAQ